MILQLNPPLWLDTPKGQALAHFMIDRGIDCDIEWVCFQQETGECWTWLNPDVKILGNTTIGREYGHC